MLFGVSAQSAAKIADVIGSSHAKEETSREAEELGK